MAIPFNTKIVSGHKNSPPASPIYSPRLPRSQNRVTLTDPCLAFGSTQKSGLQYQKVKIFKGFYNDPNPDKDISNCPIPEIFVSSPNGTKKKIATGINPFETKYGNDRTPTSLRCPETFSSRVVLVSEYNPGSTTTYIKIEYLKRHPNDFLYICGTGPGMSWKLEEALPLRFMGNNRWVYETREDFREFEYRIVLNRKIWETFGHIILKDHTQNITPRFI